MREEWRGAPRTLATSAGVQATAQGCLVTISEIERLVLGVISLCQVAGLALQPRWYRGRAQSPKLEANPQSHAGGPEGKALNPDCWGTQFSEKTTTLHKRSSGFTAMPLHTETTTMLVSGGLPSGKHPIEGLFCHYYPLGLLWRWHTEMGLVSKLAL